MISILSKTSLRNITLMGIFVCSTVQAQNNWNVPADQKAKNSYIKFDAASAKEGEAIYTKSCASCHGNPTQGNVMKSLNPVPPDLGMGKTQALTDGELIYILNTGRGLMPSFKNVLSESERWKVISYMRSFNKNYVQVLSKTDPTRSARVQVSTIFDAARSSIKISVNAKEKAGVVALKNTEVSAFVKRYFGNLQIGKTARTNDGGQIEFVMPKDIPGDKNGNIEIVVKINDEVYGEVERKKNMKIGVPTDKPALNAERAIWNVLAKVPIWLLITYVSIVLGVAAVIGYVVLNLLKIKKSGINQ